MTDCTTGNDFGTMVVLGAQIWLFVLLVIGILLAVRAGRAPWPGSPAHRPRSVNPPAGPPDNPPNQGSAGRPPHK